MPDSSVPTLKVSTRLTLVDVTVTDAKGHPVHGLTQADFTVKEDGKPQPIKNFEAFGRDKLLNASSAPPLPPDVYSNQQISQPGSAAGVAAPAAPAPKTRQQKKAAHANAIKRKSASG